MSPEPTRPVEPMSPVTLEVNVRAALALSRATALALITLSPKAHRAMMDALGVEAAMQEAQGGLVSEMVATVIRGHLDQLK